MGATSLARLRRPPRAEPERTRRRAPLHVPDTGRLPRYLERAVDTALEDTPGASLPYESTPAIVWIEDTDARGTPLASDAAGSTPVALRAHEVPPVEDEVAPLATEDDVTPLRDEAVAAHRESPELGAAGPDAVASAEAPLTSDPVAPIALGRADASRAESDRADAERTGTARADAERTAAQRSGTGAADAERTGAAPAEADRAGTERPADGESAAGPAALMARLPGTQALGMLIAADAPGAFDLDALEEGSGPPAPEAIVPEDSAMPPPAAPIDPIVARFPLSSALPGDALAMPASEQSPDDARAAAMEARSAHAGVVATASRAHDTLISDANSTLRGLAEVHDQERRDIVSALDSALAELDMVCEGAGAQVDQVAARAMSAMEAAYAQALRYLAFTGASARGTLNAVIAAAPGQISTVVDDAARPYQDVVREKAGDVGTRQTRATNRLRTWQSEAAAAFPDTGTGAQRTRNEAKRVHAPRAVTSAIQQIDAQAPAAAQNLRDQIDPLREQTRQSIEPQLNRSVDAVRNRGRPAVESALRSAREGQREQGREARATLRQMRRDGHAQVRAARTAGRARLFGSARLALGRLAGERQAAASGIARSVRASLPGYQRLARRVEASVRSAAKRGPLAVRSVARQQRTESIRTLDGLQRAQGALLARSGSSARTGLARHGSQAASEYRDALSATLLQLVEVQASFAPLTQATAQRYGEGFDDVAKQVADTASTWARSVPDAIAATNASARQSAVTGVPNYRTQLTTSLNPLTNWLAGFDNPVTALAAPLAQVANAAIDDVNSRTTRLVTAIRGSFWTGPNTSGITGALRGLTAAKGQALRELYTGPGGGNLDFDLRRALLDESEYNAAIAYLAGNTAEGARHELNASRHWYNDEEARIEEIMRSLSPSDLAALEATPEGRAELEATRGALDGTDLNVFDALRAGNHARADAYRLRDRIDEARRDGDADAVHTALAEMSRAPAAAAWGGRGEDEVSGSARREAVMREFAQILAGTPAGEAGVAIEQEQAEERVAEYVTRPIEVPVPSGGEGPPQTVTLTLTGANADLARDLIRDGEGSRTVRASRLAVELGRSGGPNVENLDIALVDDRLNPRNFLGMTPERRAEAEAELRAENDAMLELFAERYGGSDRGRGAESARAYATERLRSAFGDDTLAADLSVSMLRGDRPDPVLAMRYTVEGAGTREAYMERVLGRMDRDEIARMRTDYRARYNEDIYDRLGVYGHGGWFTELSGDDRLRMERMLLGVPRNDRERAEVAALEARQQREETGFLGRALMSGSIEERLLEHGHSELLAAAGVSAEDFDRYGILRAGAGRFGAEGEFTGPDRERFEASMSLARAAAQSYSAGVDYFAGAITGGIAILGAIAAAVATVATGGAASPLLLAAIALGTGLLSMAANRMVSGGRYGWEQAGIDLGMTAVQALTAGAGGALGLASRGGSQAVGAGMRGLTVSRSLLAGAGRLTGSAFGDMVLIGALTGGLGGLGGAALNEQTWAKGGGNAIGMLFEGLLRGALSGAATATVTNALEAIPVGRAVGGVRPTLGTRLGESTSGLARGLGRAGLSSIGAATGRGTELLFDRATGRFRGDAGDIFAAMREAGTQGLFQGLGEGVGEARAQRGFNAREAARMRADAEAARARAPAEGVEPGARRAPGGAEAAAPPRPAAAAELPRAPAPAHAAPEAPPAPRPRAPEPEASAAPPPRAPPPPEAAAPAAPRRAPRVPESEASFADFDSLIKQLRDSPFGYELEAARRRAPEPLPEDTARSRARVDAIAHERARRAPPPGRVAGAEVQHWTKTLDVTRNLPPGMAPLHPDVINESLSWLQSRRDRPATALHTDPRGGGTRYYVDDVPRGRFGDRGMAGEQLDLFGPPSRPRTPDYGTEHKFADQFLIPEAARRIADARRRAGLPPLDPRMLAIAAGEMARWQMEGTPGPARSGAVVDVAARASAAAAAPTEVGAPRARPTGQLELPFEAPVRLRVEAEPARVRVASEAEMETAAARRQAEIETQAGAEAGEAARPTARARAVEPEGTAARIPLSAEMTQAPEVTLRDPGAALRAALPEVVGPDGPLAGFLRGPVAFETGANGPRAVVSIERADGGGARVVIEVGPIEGTELANFRRTPGAHADAFTVTVSDRARAAVVPRAIAHELGELRYHGLPGRAGATDVLRPGVRPAADSALSAHDHGRLAELRVLARQVAAAEAAGSATEAARLRHEAQVLASELGLVHGAAADARATLARGAVADDAAAASLLDAARSGARSNPLLTPRTGTLDDLPLLSRQIDHALRIGDAELAVRLTDIAGARLAQAGALDADPVLAARARAEADAAVGNDPAARRLVDDALERRAASIDAAHARAQAEQARIEAASARRRAADLALEVALERALGADGRSRGRLQRMEAEAARLASQADAHAARADALDARAAHGESIAVRPVGTTAAAAAGEVLPVPRRTEVDHLSDAAQVALVRQRYADAPEFQDWLEFRDAYFKHNPSLRMDDPADLERVFGYWRGGMQVNPETGRTRTLSDLPRLAAGPGVDVDLGGERSVAGTVRVRDRELPVGEALGEREALRNARRAKEAELAATDDLARRAQLRTEIDRLGARINDVSEALGVAAGRNFAGTLSGPPVEVPVPRAGAGVPDLFYEDPATGRLIIVECKGGTSELGERRASVGGRTVLAEQGTPEYLRSLAAQMAGNVGNPEIAALGARILAALDRTPPAIDFYVVRQPIGEGGDLQAIEATRYPIERDGR